MPRKWIVLPKDRQMYQINAGTCRCACAIHVLKCHKVRELAGPSVADNMPWKDLKCSPYTSEKRGLTTGEVVCLSLPSTRSWGTKNSARGLLLRLLSRRKLGKVPYFDIGSISVPKEQGSELRPDRCVVPMLTKYVSRGGVSLEPVEPDDSSGNGFPRTVVGKDVVSLSELRVGNRGGVDHRFIVAEHHGWSVNGYTEVAKGIS